LNRWNRPGKPDPMDRYIIDTFPNITMKYLLDRKYLNGPLIHEERWEAIRELGTL